jgi:hypothetical protein
MHPWTRDLGTVTPETIEAALAPHRKRPTLADYKAIPESESHKKRGLDAQDEAVSHLEGHKETVDAALAMATAGLQHLGGEAHVFIGGADRTDNDESSGNKGNRLVSVTVVLTKVIDQ